MEYLEEYTYEMLTKNLIDNFFSSESYKKLMCEIIFLKQGDNEKVRSYLEENWEIGVKIAHGVEERCRQIEFYNGENKGDAHEEFCWRFETINSK